jgi:phage terminase large subunit
VNCRGQRGAEEYCGNVRIRPEGYRRAQGARQREYGVKWLSELEEIIIDAERCPNTWREFYGYELERDANGNLKAEYPDRDNHSIDAVRYALQNEITNTKVR